MADQTEKLRTTSREAFELLCERDPMLRSILQEAQKPRYREDPNFCRTEMWRALPQDRGHVGLLYLLKQRVGWGADGSGASEENKNSEAYDVAYRVINDALPPCAHQGGCRWDFAVPPAGSDSLKRQSDKPGFFNILHMLANAAGTGPEPVSVVNWKTSITWKKFDEPVFLVRTVEDQRLLWLNIDGSERVDSGQFSLWYSKNGVQTVSSVESAVAALEEKNPDDIKKISFGRPVVLTFPSEKLIKHFTEAGIPTAQVNGIPTSWGAFQREVVFVGKAKQPGAADMPDAILDGWLGEICRTRMSRHAIAYAWPALLTAAGMLVDGKANLFTCLVGGQGTGKGQAIDHANRLMGLTAPQLMELKSGSAEGLAALIGDVQGAPRLFSPDELLHTMEKAQIEGASFASFLNTAFDGPLQNLTMARGRRVTFNCRLSIIGGLVTDKFGDAFGGKTTGGLYDRFIFGLGPTGYTYHYQPFEGGPAVSTPDNDNGLNAAGPARPIPVTIDPSVYRETSAWLTADPKLGRLVQLAIRVAYIAAAFDNRPLLHADHLGPARAFLDYQKLVRQAVAPNSGANTEGILCSKFLTYLAACENDNLPTGEREMFKATHAYDYGAGCAGKALGALVLNGDVEEFKVGRKKYVRLTKD